MEFVFRTLENPLLLIGSGFFHVEKSKEDS